MKRAKEGYCSGGQETFEVIAYWKRLERFRPLYISSIDLKMLRDELNGNRFACMLLLHWNWSYIKKIDISIVLEDLLLCIGCTLQNCMLE